MQWALVTRGGRRRGRKTVKEEGEGRIFDLTTGDKRGEVGRRQGVRRTREVACLVCVCEGEGGGGG
jgi:hypothetical protein